MDTVDHQTLKVQGRWWLRDLPVVARLSFADYVHEGRLSFCLVLGLSAVLTPLLVLFGLKFGIISTMSQELSEDPRSREIRPLGQGLYDPDFFRALEARPDVAFVMPKTRYLAAVISLRNPADPRPEPVHTELTPSAMGDPLLSDIPVPPDGFAGIILSTPAAEALRVRAGDRVEGQIGRIRDSGEPEVVRRESNVDAILPPARSARVEALVSLPFLLAAEDFREGFAVPEFDAPGRSRPEGERLFAAFRLYARTIDDVAGLRAWLAERGIRGDTRMAEIELIQRLERSLDILYLVVAGLGGTGYLLSLMVTLWASTERKRRELSVLRLAGLRRIALAFLPGFQATFTALLGSILASGLYFAAEALINRLFRENLTGQQVLSRLEIHHFAIAAGVTVAFAVVASVAAGFRAAGISPSEGLRDE